MQYDYHWDTKFQWLYVEHLNETAFQKMIPQPHGNMLFVGVEK